MCVFVCVCVCVCMFPGVSIRVRQRLSLSLSLSRFLFATFLSVFVCIMNGVHTTEKELHVCMLVCVCV